MKILPIAGFAFVFLCGIRAPAMGAECKAIVAGLDPSQSTEGCLCDKALHNLEATLPPPMRIVAVCDLTWGRQIRIDLPVQRISLNDYHADGEYPMGTVFIAGKMSLSGEFHYEPSDGGDGWFTPNTALVSEKHKALASELRSLKFSDLEDMKNFSMLEPLLESHCFTASATIEIDGIRLAMGDTDYDGAWPINPRIKTVSRFKACTED